MTVSSKRSFAFSAVCTVIALCQWVALLAIPQLLRPYWGAYLALMGGERSANILGNFLVSSTVLLFNNLFYLALYRAQLPFFESFSINPWPWMSPKPEVVAHFTATVWKGTGLTVLNALLTLPLGWLSYSGAKHLGYSGAVDTFPSVFTMAWQLVVCMLVEDLLFYWGHRTLHHPSIYSQIHKVHHAFYYTVAVSATATHPVEYILSNVIPFVAGPTLLGSHCITIYAWILLRVGETTVNHSGYSLPWSMYELLPFQGSAEDHCLHHSAGGGVDRSGTFGSLFTFWDTVCGTHLEKHEKKG
jgi:sterol desaturase/sphingolipid hydroxylase (fatty acid hydroxylase superfamily)